MALLFIHEDKIAWAGPQSALPLKYSAMAFTEVPVLLPGLWDCHVHFSGDGPDSGTAGYDQIVIMVYIRVRIRGLRRRDIRRCP